MTTKAEFSIRGYNPVMNGIQAIKHETFEDGTGRVTTQAIQFTVGQDDAVSGTLLVNWKNNGVVIAEKPSTKHLFTRGWAALDPAGSDTKHGLSKNTIDRTVFLTPGVVDKDGNMVFAITSSSGVEGSVTINFVVEYKPTAA
jgi:hypothetical protein